MNRSERRSQARLQRMQDDSQNAGRDTGSDVHFAWWREGLERDLGTLLEIARKVGFVGFAGFAWVLIEKDEYLLGMLLIVISSVLLPDSPLLEKLGKHLRFCIAVAFCICSLILANGSRGDKPWSKLARSRPFKVRTSTTILRDGQDAFVSYALISNAKYVYDLDVVLDASLDNMTSSSIAVSALSVDIKCSGTGWQRLTRVPSADTYDHLVLVGPDTRRALEMNFTDLVNKLAMDPVEAGKPVRGLILGQYPRGFTCPKGPVNFRFKVVDFAGNESVIYPEEKSAAEEDAVTTGTSFKVGQTYDISGMQHLRSRSR